MVADITTLISGIITNLGSLIDLGGTGDNTIAYAALLALPVLGGVVAFGRRLVKKAR